ncbi:MAG TPA: twin-arginine translocase TatA/TatE family subunit [Gaiellaceae bacterium]|jgi:sec-independent protein translocase protein TatA|nr:twin-arginine translocase TatA/TatE family subunit [Gaiellaceae bacterium]
MPGGIGWMEILLLLLVMLLVFGPKRLPEMGRSLGRGIREFKESVTGEDKDDDDEPRKTELTPPPAAAPDATTTQRESERV